VFFLYLKAFFRGIIVVKAQVTTNFATRMAYLAVAVTALVFVGMLLLTQLHP